MYDWCEIVTADVFEKSLTVQQLTHRSPQLPKGIMPQHNYKFVDCILRYGNRYYCYYLRKNDLAHVIKQTINNAAVWKHNYW